MHLIQIPRVIEVPLVGYFIVLSAKVAVGEISSVFDFDSLSLAVVSEVPVHFLNIVVSFMIDVFFVLSRAQV